MATLMFDSALAVGQIQRRPKDRRAHIAQAAAEVFSMHGYHAASMKTIAAKVGISGPALYRHYSSKYAMFAAAVLDLGQHLADSSAFVDDITDSDMAGDPSAILRRVVDAVIEVTLSNRESGGLYRWQARYLHTEHLAALLSQLRVTNRRIQRPLAMMRWSLSAQQRWMLSSGMLSVIGSIVDHRTRLPTAQLHALLAEAVSAMLAARLPEPTDEIGASPAGGRILSPDAGTHEALLDTAMVLFGSRGYAGTTMTLIAEGAGVPVSGIYRYFPGKYEILSTGLRRVAEWVTSDLLRVADSPGEPYQVLMRLIETYVATSFANPELPLVYYTERFNLEDSDQAFLRNLLRSAVDAWATRLISVRMDLDAGQARVLVHAAMALVIDLGWLVGYDRLVRNPQPSGNSVHLQACLRTLIAGVLLRPADQRMW